MTFSLRMTRRMARLLPFRDPHYRTADRPAGNPRVLVAGIYVGDKPNYVEHICAVLADNEAVQVKQRWCCMRGQVPADPLVRRLTVQHRPDYHPKWPTLTELTGDRPWEEFDYVVYVDDDIRLGAHFLDRFIALQQKFDLSLAQPARTWRSITTDHNVVRRRIGSVARRTRFVEVGPVTSMDRRFVQLAMPFSEESPMGWGYDLTWPLLAEEHGLRLGIVDATPVDHSLRKQGQLYANSPELARMNAYLDKREFIKPHERVTLEYLR